MYVYVCVVISAALDIYCTGQKLLFFTFSTAVSSAGRYKREGCVMSCAAKYRRGGKEDNEREMESVRLVSAYYHSVHYNHISAEEIMQRGGKGNKK